MAVCPKGIPLEFIAGLNSDLIRAAFHRRRVLLAVVGKKVVMAVTAFDAAACIGCGACVAACPNATAMLFTSAKVTHLNSLPQGQPERDERTLNMVAAMTYEDFGSCTNHGECTAACPKGIPLEFIAGLNRDLIRAAFHRHREPLAVVGAPQQPVHEDA